MKRGSLTETLADRPLGNSEALRKSSSEMRRCATSIRTQAAKIAGAISAEDAKTLAKAAEILDGLAWASKRASSIRKAREDEKSRVFEERRQEALSLIRGRYQPAGWREAMKVAIAIAKAHRPAFPTYSEKDVREHMDWITRNARFSGADPSKSMSRSIEDGLNDVIEALAWSAASRDLPVAENLMAAFPKIDDAIAKESAALADEVAAFLVAAELEKSARAAEKA